MKPVFVVEIAGHFIRITDREVTLAAHIKDGILVAVIEVHHLNLVQRVDNRESPVAGFLVFDGIVKWYCDKPFASVKVNLHFAYQLFPGIL